MSSNSFSAATEGGPTVTKTHAVTILTVTAAALLAGTAFADEPDVANGKRIYQQTCIACHGPDGTGTLPGTPDFTEAGGRLSQPEDVLVRHVLEGFRSPGSPMAMPPKGGNSSLTEDDVEDVLAYIRQTFKRE